MIFLRRVIIGDRRWENVMRSELWSSDLSKHWRLYVMPQKEIEMNVQRLELQVDSVAKMIALYHVCERATSLLSSHDC